MTKFSIKLILNSNCSISQLLTVFLEIKKNDKFVNLKYSFVAFQLPDKKNVTHKYAKAFMYNKYMKPTFSMFFKYKLIIKSIKPWRLRSQNTNYLI